MADMNEVAQDKANLNSPHKKPSLLEEFSESFDDGYRKRDGEIRQAKGMPLPSSPPEPKGVGISGLFMMLGGSWFISPRGQRAAVSKRILEEKDFAATFRDGKFLELHKELNPSYMASSTGVVDWFKKLKADIKLEADVSKALKAERLSYKALWKGTSFTQKLADVVFSAVVIVGLGFVVKSLSSSRKSSDDVSPTVVVLPKEASIADDLSAGPVKYPNHPAHHQVSGVTMEGPVQQTNVPAQTL